jgi:hypothetical protein
MILSIVASFSIALLVRSFYIFLQIKKDGKKLRLKQGILESIGCLSIVAIGYILGQLGDWLSFAHLLDGSFLLSVVIPAIIWLWYIIKPDVFHKREKQAMVLLSYCLVLIFIIPILGS